MMPISLSEKESSNEEALDEIRFYFTLLAKGLISIKNISNLYYESDIKRLDYNGKFFDRFNYPLKKSFLNFNNNPHNSLLVEFFCKKAIRELNIYLLFEPNLVLPIIKEYIDRVLIILLFIQPRIAKNLLQEDPGWFLLNFHKFYYKNYETGYSAVEKAALDFKNNPDNLQTIAEDAIAKLERIRIIQLF